MTDLEINQALALAIGWKRMLPNPEADGLKQCWVWTGQKWRLFDYKDWRVIGPIAERYDCFPCKFAICKKRTEWGAYSTVYGFADTPQKAIALAVIKGAKK